LFGCSEAPKGKNVVGKGEPGQPGPPGQKGDKDDSGTPGTTLRESTASCEADGVTASQLAQTTFVTVAGASDHLLVGASDGHVFSGWTDLHIV
jgi:hypothetical protein